MGAEKVSVSNTIAMWFIVAMLPSGIDSYIFHNPTFDSKYKCVEFIVERHEALNDFIAGEYNINHSISSKFYCMEKNFIKEIEDMSGNVT